MIWIHVASLGEYEQGLPLMEALRIKYPNYKLLLTFFSPSGYEVKKNNTIADVTVYLPMDTISNVRQFLKIVEPEMVFFIKYEYWPNYLNALKKENIPTYLVSGIMRKDQVFFKWYGGFYKKALQAFTHFFVQNEETLNLLNSLKYTNVTIVGDTRFDRVSQILEQDNKLTFLDAFTENKSVKTIVIGSSWPEDEKLICHYINSNTNPNIKFIFAPHNIKQEQIDQLTLNIQKPVIKHTEYVGQDLTQYNVYIIDAYSLLTKAYSYATIAYIGGGFGAGIHNILEAATFSIPIVIGPKYRKFQEAKDLIKLGGCLVVNNQEEVNKLFDSLLTNDIKRKAIGEIAGHFILKNKNATQKVIQYL